MKKLIQATSLTTLLFVLNGCSVNNLNEATKPKIDNTIEVVDNSSIRSIADINAIAFEWKKVEDARVSGYNFYRANTQKGEKKLKLIKTIDNKNTTHFLDKNVDANTKYVYKISSATNGEVESRTTQDYYVTTLANLAPISFVHTVTNLPRQIKITWRPHLSQKVNSYIIERSDPINKKWIPIKTVEGRLQAEYIDKPLGDNKVYSYRVIAKTFDGIKSSSSKIIKAKTKPLPFPVTSLKVTDDQPKAIILTWEHSKNSDITKYNIYRSSFVSFGFSKIQEVNAQTFKFTNKINEDGKKYFYKVSAIDKDGLESILDLPARLGTTLEKPEKPTITLAQIQGGKAILNWITQDDRAVSFTIYKTEKESFFKYKTTKFTNISDLRFQDENIVRGLEYKYSVQAIDKFGLISDKTDTTQLVLPTIQKEKR